MSVLREVAKAQWEEVLRRCGDQRDPAWDELSSEQQELSLNLVRIIFDTLDRAGWQAVPKVATPAMEDAGQMLGCWEDILAVAPKIEGPQ